MTSRTEVLAEQIVEAVEGIRRVAGGSPLTLILPSAPSPAIKQVAAHLVMDIEVDPDCPPGRFYVQVND